MINSFFEFLPLRMSLEPDWKSKGCRYELGALKQQTARTIFIFEEEEVEILVSPELSHASISVS